MHSTPSFVLLAIVIATPSTAVSQNGWTQLANGPTQLAGHRMVHDSARARIVMYGGESGSVSRATWEYDGKAWSKTLSTSPMPYLRDFALAYAPSLKRTLLYGGWITNQTNRGEAGVWAYDGKAWTNLHQGTGTAPAPRYRHAAAWDSNRGRLVLFGGSPFTSSYPPQLADTWEFDGKTWTQVQTKNAPRGRYFHMMAYDEQRKVVVLYGGTSFKLITAGWFPETMGDHWEYDGKDWKEISASATPGGRYSAGLTYDPWRHRMVLNAGGAPNSRPIDTWEWNGKEWRSTGKSADRHDFGIAFCSNTGRVVAFGGKVISSYGFSTDARAWSYGPTMSHEISNYGKSCGSSAGNLTTSVAPLVATPRFELIATGHAGQSAVTLVVGTKQTSQSVFGCTLLVEPTWLTAGASDSAGQARFAAPIPPLPALAGVRLYAQSFGLGTSWTATDGLQVRIGD